MQIIKKIFSILKYFKKKIDIILIFGKKNNNSSIRFHNISVYQIKKKNKKILSLFSREKKILFTLNNKGKAYVLYDRNKNQPVGSCWYYKVKKNWYVEEINKYINFKDIGLLYDFYILKKFRNRGYYKIFLNSMLQKFSKDKIQIYCSLFNYYSLKGIIKSNFSLKKICNNFWIFNR